MPADTGRTGTGDSGGGGDTSSSTSFLVIGDSGSGSGDDHDRRSRQHFVRTLDSKLKKLQKHHHHHQHSHAVADNRHSKSSRKPVFVTTVKTGIFLDPPPDLAALLGLDTDRSSPSAIGGDSNRYYSYSSKPRVLYDKQHQRTATVTDQKNDMCKQMGYTNIMHDKRVVRGSNFSKKPYLGKESSTALEAEIRRRSMARKKAMDHQTRALRLRLGAPKLTRGRQNVDIQTDTALEEFYDYPPSQTCGAQTEFETEEQFSNPGTGKSAGTDASTQVDDKEFFDFDTEVIPIAEAVVTDVFRQAMREVLYEDELDARARQQRALYLRRTIDDIEKQRLEHEDERLNKVITDHAQFMNEGGKTRLPEPNSSHGDNTSTVKNPDPEFMSWLEDEIKAHKSKDMDNDDILKSIIEDLVKRRM